MTNISAELIAFFRAEKRNPHLQPDLENLNEVMSGMTSNADAALVRAINLQRAITQTKVVLEALDPAFSIKLSEFLLRCESELQKHSETLAMAICDLRSQYRSMLTALESVSLIDNHPS